MKGWLLVETLLVLLVANAPAQTLTPLEPAAKLRRMDEAPV